VRSLAGLVGCIAAIACGRSSGARRTARIIAAATIAVAAAAGCGRDAAPSARAAASSGAAAPAAPPPVPPPDTTTPLEAREPGDRCRRESAAAPRALVIDSFVSSYEDIRPRLAFRCTLRAGRPARLVLETRDFGDPAAVLVYDPPDAPAAADTLLLSEAEPPYRGAPIVEGEDLDGDGWTDVRVMTFHGSGGRMFDVFRYAPARRRFEKDTVLSGGGNIHRVGAACVRDSWAMGVGTWSSRERCWRNGRWVATRGESQEYSSALSTRDVSVSIHEIRELRGGRMRVVSVDTVRERGR